MSKIKYVIRKVIGIGGAVLDIIFKNDQPIGTYPGGSTFSGLISLGQSGARTTFINETGNDRVGNTIHCFLEQDGVDASHVNTFPDNKSPISLAFLNEKSDAEYLFYEDYPHDQLDFAFPDIQPDNIVIFDSYYAVSPIIRPQMIGLLDYARSHGAIIYCDISFKPAHQHNVTRITPNPSENLGCADIVRGNREDSQTLYKPDDAARVYQAEMSFYRKRFIYTQGAKASQLFAGNNFYKAYPVPDEAPVSTIGAGDNFSTGVLFGLLKHGITHQMLEQGLSEEQWDQIISYGLRFASESYKNIHNYADTSSANQMKARLTEE